MKNNLSPGDLAIIIKSVDGISVGRVVQCLRAEGSHTKHGLIWYVSSKEDLVSEYGMVGKNMHVPQDWLKKIEPPPLPEKTRELVLVQK
jgi:hypothetical protein